MERKRELQGRERGVSVWSIEELWKRKREGKEGKVFEKSKKTPRSPEGEGEEEGVVREKRWKEDKTWFEGWRGGVEGMMKEMMEELRGWREEMIVKMKEEWREGREEMRRMSEEMREGREEVRKEVEGMERAAGDMEGRERKYEKRDKGIRGEVEGVRR